MASQCPRCGSPVNAGDLFCLNCGAMLDPKLGGNSWASPAPVATKPAAQASTTQAPAQTQAPTQQAKVVPTTKPVATKPVSAYGTVTTKAARTFGGEEQATPSYAVPQQSLNDEGDDSYTIVVDDDDDPDAPTFVFVEEPVLTLTRLRNGQTIELGELPAMVGKGTKATARIAGNRGISRQHALISQVEDGYALEDNASTNGTFIGDVRLGAHVPTPLEDGMTFRLADEEFEFHVD